MQINPEKSSYTSAVMIESGINTVSELIVFLREVLGIRIPNSHMCNNKTHLPPFRLLSDMFLAKVHNAVGLANRSGSKSFSAGILTFLRSIFPQSSTRLLGGSVDQSDKSYQAFADCWKISGLGSQQLATEVQQKKTRLKNGVAVEILTASDKSVRGPHQENLILDEIDVMEPKIFEASLSQPQSKGNNKASTLILSTRHVAGGLMEQVIEDHKKMGLTLYVWCIWEVLESCKDYSCSTCPLASICPGKQMKNAVGYYTIEDLVSKLKVLDEESFDSEWLCEKPSRKQFVYSKFNEDVHVIDCDFNPSIPFSLSIDWGGIDPFVVLVWQQISQRGDVIVDEFYQPNIDNQRVIDLCKGMDWWKYVSGVTAYCDPARQDLIAEWRTAGINAVSRKSTTDDINLVRAKIAPMRGEPTLYVNRKCKMTIWEFNHYRTDKDNHPIKKNDHACYSKDTDVLTLEGWKKFPEIIKSDKILTLNHQTGIMSYELPTQFIKKYFKSLIEYDAARMNFCVSSDHSMLITSQYSHKVSKQNIMYLKKLNDIDTVEFWVKKNGDWRGRKKSVFRYGKFTMPMRDFLEFYGLWLAEGSAYYKKGLHYRIIVHQKEGNRELESILSRVPLKLQHYRNPNTGVIAYEFQSKDLYYFLKQFGHAKDKFIHKDFKLLDRISLERLFNGLMLGDGCWKNHTPHYDTISEKLAGDFLDLLIKIGRSGTIKKYDNRGHIQKIGDRFIIAQSVIYRVLIHKSPFYNLTTKKLKNIEYNDYAYCVDVPNHIIYVKRKGFAFWCGNCDAIRYYVRGTKITTDGDRPRVILGPRRDLLGKPLGTWPLWKGE